MNPPRTAEVSPSKKPPANTAGGPYCAISCSIAKGYGMMRVYFTPAIEAPAAPYDVPFALALEYRRDIPGARIVAASVDEMRRLGAPEPDLQRWEDEMKRLFPDVRNGDTITGFFLPGQGARFYLGRRALGELADPEFARRFFAIWLDPRTSAPAVRAALLGLPPG